MTPEKPDYQIRMRSKGVEVSFETDDPSFAFDQLASWVRHLFGIDLSLYKPDTLAATGITTASVVETSVPEVAADTFEQAVENTADPVENSPVLEVQPDEKSAPGEPIAEFSTSTEVPVENPEEFKATADLNPASDDASNNNLSQAPVETQENQEDPFDDFVDSLLSSVTNEPEQPAQTQLAFDTTAMEKEENAAGSATATAVLDRPIENNALPRVSFDSLEVDSLKELFGYAQKATMGEDYLLLSTYFLDRFRGQGAVSLREINAELVRSGMTPINHAILETAVSKSFMALVPDTTGSAFATEYRLTDDGLRTLKNLFE